MIFYFQQGNQFMKLFNIKNRHVIQDILISYCIYNIKDVYID